MKPEWKPEVLVMQSSDFFKCYYDYYGISIHSVSAIKEAEKIIKTITKENPYAVIFVGGSGAALLYNKFRNEKFIVPVFMEGEKFFGDIDVSNLDNIDFPARYLLPANMIKHDGLVHHSDKPSTTMIATRGCVYNCAFCDRKTSGRKFRKRTVQNVIQEVVQLKNVYGIQHIRFIDDCITFDKQWFASLCIELQAQNITWTCLSRADCIDEKLLKLMKNAGCTEIFFGFESGSQKMLNLMKKHSTVEDNIKAVKMCKDAGIVSCAYMMFGFPGEDYQSVVDTIKFLDTAKPDKSRISTFVAIPGTDVWENPSKYHVKIKTNYEDYWYFDQHDFCLDYDYIGNTIMAKLRDKIMDFYADKKYLQEWVKPVCIS
jgi:radical SAM superfamily enzyme YgiQ (UPF0313 family)